MVTPTLSILWWIASVLAPAGRAGEKSGGSPEGLPHNGIMRDDPLRASAAEETRSIGCSELQSSDPRRY